MSKSAIVFFLLIVDLLLYPIFRFTRAELVVENGVRDSEDDYDDDGDAFSSQAYHGSSSHRSKVPLGSHGGNDTGQ